MISPHLTKSNGSAVPEGRPGGGSGPYSVSIPKKSRLSIVHAYTAGGAPVAGAQPRERGKSFGKCEPGSLISSDQDGSAVPEGRPGGGSGPYSVSIPKKSRLSIVHAYTAGGAPVAGAQPRERGKSFGKCEPGSLISSDQDGSAVPEGRPGGGSGPYSVSIPKKSLHPIVPPEERSAEGSGPYSVSIPKKSLHPIVPPEERSAEGSRPYSVSIPKNPGFRLFPPKNALPEDHGLIQSVFQKIPAFDCSYISCRGAAAAGRIPGSVIIYGKYE